MVCGQNAQSTMAMWVNFNISVCRFRIIRLVAMATIRSFDWQKHRSELDRIFFKSFPLVPRSVSGALNL